MIPLPALRGDDPLGYLAALGVLSLSEHDLLPPLRLAWSGTTTPVACVEGDLSDLRDLVTDAFHRVADSGRAVPGVDGWFPLKVVSGKQEAPPAPPSIQSLLDSERSAWDPMRLPSDQASVLFREAEAVWQQNPWLSRWLLAMSAQVTEDAKGVELTPFYAPTGRMTLRGSIFDSTAQAVKQIDGPADALTHWVRTSYDGANFDERAVRDSVVATDGRASNRGAPSPTWLAAMSLRFFPMVESGRSTSTVGWIRDRLYPGYTNRSLVWPTWDPPLDPPAVRTLLAHPAVRPEITHPGRVRFDGAALTGLEVTGVFGSSRRTRTQGDGPLGPAVRLWPQ